jgi:hypothetical protein
VGIIDTLTTYTFSKMGEHLAKSLFHDSVRFKVSLLKIFLDPDIGYQTISLSSKISKVFKFNCGLNSREAGVLQPLDMSIKK